MFRLGEGGWGCGPSAFGASWKEDHVLFCLF